MKIYEVLEARGPKPIPIPDNIAQQIVDLYSQGMYPKDIASKTGLSHSKIFRYLKALPNSNEIQATHYSNVNAEPGRGINRRFSANEIQDMAQKYAQGISAVKIGREYKIRYTSVLYHLQKMPNWLELRAENIRNGTRVGAKGIDRNQIQRMAELYAKGDTFEKIAAQFNVTGPTVRIHLERLPTWPKIIASHYAKQRKVKKYLRID